MAEALGVASGVVGIKDAESEVMTTYNSIRDLTQILLLIKSTLDNQDFKLELQRIKLSPLRDTIGERLLSQARRAINPFKKSTLIKLQEIIGDLQDRLHLTLTTHDINTSLQHFDIVSGQLKYLSTEVDKTQLGIGNIQNSLAGLDHKIDTIESLYGNEYLQRFSKWLSPIFDIFEKKQHDIFELPGRQDGTWEWLQSTQEFKNWLSRTDRTLWCPGQRIWRWKDYFIVGSTICKKFAPLANAHSRSSIINHLEMKIKQPSTGIAYIYCDYSNTLLTVPNLIASLLQQLFRQSPKIPDGLLEIYKSYTTKTIHLSLREYSAFLRDVIESFSEVFVVVDGLDECPHRTVDDIRDEFLDQLKGLPLKTQLLFTSRDLPSIALKFAADQRLEIHASKHAIKGYLQERIKSSKNLSRHIQRKPSLREAIVETVAQKSDGMFLLVRIYIDLLAAKNVLGMVEYTLRNLPEGLKELDTAYEDVLTRIQNQDDDDVRMAKQILTWLYYAARPLTLQELRHSLAVAIASVCAGIVTYHAESNTVSFIHYTTKEYFRRRMDRQEIAETCLMYLSFELFSFEQFLAVKAEHRFGFTFHEFTKYECPDLNIDIYCPLFRYAARYWGDHVNSMLGKVTKDLLMSFLRRPSFFGLKEIVMILLEDGQDIEGKDEHNWTALHMAARRGHAELVQLLVDKGARVNAVSKVPTSSVSGATALHWAAQNGHEKVLEILLKNGAEIDLQTLHGETALHWAAENGHVGAITLLLNKGANLETKSEAGKTPLLTAAWAGEEAAMKILIERDAALFPDTDYSRDSLLHIAAAWEKGFNVNYRNKWGESALWSAAGIYSQRQDDVVRLLLKKGRQHTALHHSAMEGFHTVVRLLLESGAEINTQTEFGDTALHLAAREGHKAGGHKALLDMLLEKEADITAETEAGDTALKLAAWGGHEAIVRHLLDRLDGEIDFETWLATSQVKNVAAAGDEEAMQLLLDKGANITGEGEGTCKETALHVAAGKGHVALTRMLLKNGANINAIDSFEKTPICRAVRDGHIEIVRLLIEHKANLSQGESPLFDAIDPRMGWGKVDTVQLLLENGADISAKSRYNRDTPLHSAARRGSKLVIKLLLEYGAVVGSKNMVGETALDISIMLRDEDISNLLVGN
ncbi:putative ankyrin repeat protein [Trichoderma evansii]